ncbi:MAG TPA: hypothetical protein PLI34_17490 [Saprospiraceae bacterium]|nr:hypothetical protein [Saprospiraceae bacterium]
MDDTAFEISGVFDEKVAEKLPIAALEDWLNQHFTLIQYGPGVQYIFVLFIVTPDSGDSLARDIMYDEEECLLQLSLRLPYQQVLNSAPDEVRFFMLESFLAAMESSDSELEIEGFDKEGFISDIKMVLS